MPISSKNKQRSYDNCKEVQNAVVWPYFLSSGVARSILQGTGKGGRRQGGQRTRWKDNIRSGVQQVPEGSREQDNLVTSHLCSPDGSHCYVIVDDDDDDDDDECKPLGLVSNLDVIGLIQLGFALPTFPPALSLIRPIHSLVFFLYFCIHAHKNPLITVDKYIRLIINYTVSLQLHGLMKHQLKEHTKTITQN